MQQGRLEGIVGGYLSKQLEYVREGHDRSVLVALVRSYGAKAQSTTEEIAGETGLSVPECETALERLLRLRLVRHIETYYEITHDLIARRILAELIDPEEREFKRYRELLAAKAAAYEATGNILTAEELLMLFRHRANVVPDAREMQLLAASWVRESVPGLYWLRTADILEVSKWLDAIWQGNDRITRASIVMLRRVLGSTSLEEEDYRSFHGYQLASELAVMISENLASVPKRVILYGLRHRREEVRESCLLAVLEQVKRGNLDWLDTLRGRKSESYRLAYQRLVIRSDAELPGIATKESRAIREFHLLKAIARAQSQLEATRALNALRRNRPTRLSFLFGKSLASIAGGKVSTLLNQAKRGSAERAEVLLGGVDSRIGAHQYGQLIVTYQEWNSVERMWDQKAMALAMAIQRVTSEEHLEQLRRSLQVIRLTQSARELVFALLRFADINDVKFILGRIGDASEEIDFWNHLGLCRTLEKQMEKVCDRGIPGFLRDLVHRLDFPGSITAEKPLPVKVIGNRNLYVRIAAFATIGKANEAEAELLVALARHPFGRIAQAAAVRLARLLGESAIERLVREVGAQVSGRRAETLASAIRWAEIDLYGKRIGTDSHRFDPQI